MSRIRVVKLLSLAAGALAGRRLGGTPSIDTSVGTSAQPSDFVFKSRTYIPYGKGEGYAFGMGAAEQAAYDHVQKYVYTVSEQGVLNVVDMRDPMAPAVVSNLAVDFSGAKLTDVEICADKNLIFIGAGAADTVGNGQVHIYSTVQRGSPAAPTLHQSVAVGPLPDMILPNGDCTLLAVANEGEGEYTTMLTDPVGSVDILVLGADGAGAVTKHSVALASGMTDDQLITMGVHLPLSVNGMQYWDDTSDIASDLDFASARSSYTPAMNLEPEYVSWSADGTKLYVNLQENNAIATVNVPASGAPSFDAIHALGLKDHTTIPIDIVGDETCVQDTYSGFKALRMPDSIQVVNIDGVEYILTANEGDDKEYGKFEEKQKLNYVVDSEGEPKMPSISISDSAKATAAAVIAASSKMRVTVGSSSIDYSNATAPVIQHIVAMGGRGISVFKDTGSSIDLIWDSTSSFEAELCRKYPNSHNGIQDEEFSPVNGVFYNASSSSMQETLDEMNNPAEDGCADGGNGQPGACPLGKTVDERSAKDGSGTEAIVAGVACGSMIAVTATEKQGVAFVYDITNISAPQLLFVKHLSPISETKNPGAAYTERTLGEIDPESMIFLEAAHSPSGKPGVIFAGAWSGTVSFWEFECPTMHTDTLTTTDAADPDGTDESSVSSASATSALSFPLGSLAALLASM